MNARIIQVAMLATAVAVSGCAMQTDDPAAEGVGRGTNELLTGPGDDNGGGTPKLDPNGGGEQTGTGNGSGQQGSPFPGDDPADKASQGDPGKPSPDPWKKPSEQQPILPGHTDPVVNPTVR